MISYEKGKERKADHQFKILIIGDSGVGKTCFLFSFVKDNLGAEFNPTVGVDVALKTLDVSGKLIKLQIWDTAGQERYRTLTNNYFHGADCIIIVYDTNNKKSFESVPSWIKTIEEKSPSNILRVLIGNKIDKNKREVHSEEGNSLAKKHNMFFYETSTKHKKNNIYIFTFISQTILIYKTQNDKENIEIEKETIVLRRKFSGLYKWYCCV